MVDASEDVTLSKLVALLILAVLTGGGLFTGYSIKTETGSFDHAEMKEVMREELRVLVRDVSDMHNNVGIIMYRQDEFSRRLERLEGH